jgi:hypothetical protein
MKVNSADYTAASTRKQRRGVFRNSLRWNLDDGAEEYYNRSFVGYAPEGQCRFKTSSR